MGQSVIKIKNLTSSGKIHQKSRIAIILINLHNHKSTLFITNQSKKKKKKKLLQRSQRNSGNQKKNMVDTIPSFLVNITPFCYENYLTPNFYPTDRDTKNKSVLSIKPCKLCHVTYTCALRF